MTKTMLILIFDEIIWKNYQILKTNNQWSFEAEKNQDIMPLFINMLDLIKRELFI